MVKEIDFLNKDRFGPIGDPEVTPWEENVIYRVRTLLENEWFHGDINQKSAEELLGTQKDDTFLIRFSSKSGWFCLSQVTQERKIKHQRIRHKPGSRFLYNGQQFESLQDLVENIGSNNFCPGSKYLPLLNEPLIGEYEQG